MIKSMTACANALCNDESLNVTVEIRSYNSRYLDTKLFLPGLPPEFEDRIKKIVKKFIQRGRVEIRVTLEDLSEAPMVYEVNQKRAQGYFQALLTLKQFLSISSEITLDHMLHDRELIQAVNQRDDFEKVWAVLETALVNALQDLDRMREKEGGNLLADLNQRMGIIETTLDKVKALAATIPEMYKKKLEKRIEALVKDGEGLDSARVAQEAAFLADKSDISEEIVRAFSHIQQFREIEASSEPGGIKLNFLVQEFTREFNTMGAKAGSETLSYLVVALKSELEKIREQVQNIE
ncbi:MAG: YicC/YloC family endoribonuclease [Thermodesulfobacteriota bacterium]|nr:YicC/YloC family endoribonuclease [Thermodesulfobacteriota bacterium]